MNCDQIKELLPFIDDGFLEQDIVADVREHIKNCPVCSHEYNEIKNILNMTHSVYVKNFPDNSQKILYTVQRRIRSRKREKEIFWRVLPVAAVILITVSVVFYSIMPKYTNDFNPQLIESTEITDTELLDYIAEYNLDAYELYELIDQIEVYDEYDLRDALFQHEYFSVSLDDIIQTLDYEELNDLFISAYN